MTHREMSPHPPPRGPGLKVEVREHTFNRVCVSVVVLVVTEIRQHTREAAIRLDVDPEPPGRPGVELDTVEIGDAAPPHRILPARVLLHRDDRVQAVLEEQSRLDTGNVAP